LLKYFVHDVRSNTNCILIVVWKLILVLTFLGSRLWGRMENLANIFKLEILQFERKNP